MLAELAEETTVKEKTREKNNWPGERKIILAKDDGAALSSKPLLGAL